MKKVSWKFIISTFLYYFVALQYMNRRYQEEKLNMFVCDERHSCRQLKESYYVHIFFPYENYSLTDSQLSYPTAHLH